MNQGFFISIEGIDGCGKSTLAANLAKALTSAGRDVLLTKEPGGSPLGRSLRAILHEQPDPLTPLAEFLLYAADRAQHFGNIVLPALAAGLLVISDRCADSSLAYQGYGHGLPLDFIKQVSAAAMQQRRPDLTMYVRIDWPTAKARLVSRAERLTAIEIRGDDYWQRVGTGFEEMYAGRNDVIVIDGTKTQEEMLASAMAALLLK